MIPFIEIPGIRIWGPFGIEPFGVLVVTGVFLGAWYGMWRGKQAGVHRDMYIDGLYWCMGGAFLMAHIVEVVFYHPERLVTEGPLSLFKVWDGLSSMGGFAGAVLGNFIFYRLIKKRRWLFEAELQVQSIIVGWIPGRLGCTFAHDHPGSHTDFFLGVQYPGGVRHDLGFYELLFTVLVMFPIIFVMHRFNPPKGSYVAAWGLVYAPIRFMFDFLRKAEGSGSDVRYLGLTPGQYAAIGMFLVGAAFAIRAWRNRDEVPGPEPYTEEQLADPKGKWIKPDR